MPTNVAAKFVLRIPFAEYNGHCIKILQISGNWLWDMPTNVAAKFVLRIPFVEYNRHCVAVYRKLP